MNEMTMKVICMMELNVKNVLPIMDNISNETVLKK